MNTRNFHESIKTSKETSFLSDKTKAFAAGALTLALAFGVNGIKEGHENDNAKLHASEQLAQFGQKDFASKYLEEGIKSEDVKLVTITDIYNNPFRIAENLRAKDVAIVAEEIYSQLDGRINTGDVVVIPNDQLNPEPRRFDRG